TKHRQGATMPLSPAMRSHRRARRTRRLLRHHLPLALGSLAATLVIAAGLSAASGQGLLWRLSVATAYVGLTLIGLTLLIGPLTALRGQPMPVSSDLRRDLGIWAGLVGIAHVFMGAQVRTSIAGVRFD